MAHRQALIAFRAHADLQPCCDRCSKLSLRFPVLALDRVLGAPDNLITSVEVHNTPLARLASDHLPIKAHLDLKTAMQLLESHNSKASKSATI